MSSLEFPVMTLLGNMNVVPELMDFVQLAASDATLRRRLIPFQEETGALPPRPDERFVLYY